MNISSISNYWLYLKTQTSYSNKAATETQSDVSTSASNLANLVYSSADGDTLELSGDQSGIGNTAGVYGPPPPPPPRPASNGNNSADSDPIKAFLDKVADGTATTEDLEDMQNVLQQTQNQSSESENSEKSGDDPIKTFLDKVAEGTATADDLSAMQSVLQQMKPPSDDQNARGNDPIGSFLDKVANGTATQDDLTEMQSILQLMQQQSGSENSLAHQQSSESDRTNLTGTSLDTTDLNSSGSDPIKEFLDKVASGTVTDDGLNTMQTILLQMQQQFYGSYSSDSGSNDTI